METTRNTVISSKVADLTIDEFRDLVRAVVIQTLSEMLGDPDEALIEEREAEQLLNNTLETSSSQSLIERRAFLELPTDSRRSLLREQAKRMVEYYHNDPEWRELEGGDLVEYEST